MTSVLHEVHSTARKGVIWPPKKRPFWGSVTSAALCYSQRAVPLSPSAQAPHQQLASVTEGISSLGLPTAAGLSDSHHVLISFGFGK